MMGNKHAHYNNNDEGVDYAAKITVADYMAKGLTTLIKDTDVIDAIKKLLDRKITRAPVIDQRGHVLGMFSEKDGMRFFAKCLQSRQERKSWRIYDPRDHKV
jgi:CBS domain-containing protein